MSRIQRISLVLFLLPLLLLGCGKKATTPPAPTPEPEPREQRASLPGASLGLYVSHFLSQGLTPRAITALRGIEAFLRFTQGSDPMESADTFALLQEFGNVLQVDIRDILNRSTDRPTTLTQYTDALTNITERSKRMAEDLENRSDDLRTEQRAARAAESDLQRRRDKAYKAQDYSTAGSLQEELGGVQLEVARIAGLVEAVRDVLNAYEKLIEVAEERLSAIEENREVIIAGLTVVKIPGIEDLGLLETIREKRQRLEADETPVLQGIEDL